MKYCLFEKEEDLHTFDADLRIWDSRSFGSQCCQSNLLLKMERNVVSIRKEPFSFFQDFPLLKKGVN